MVQNVISRTIPAHVCRTLVIGWSEIALYRRSVRLLGTRIDFLLGLDYVDGEKVRRGEGVGED